MTKAQELARRLTEVQAAREKSINDAASAAIESLMRTIEKRVEAGESRLSEDLLFEPWRPGDDIRTIIRIVMVYLQAQGFQSIDFAPLHNFWTWRASFALPAVATAEELAPDNLYPTSGKTNST
jgi:hypothetical protein